ncbi:hypothetical protein L1987_55724 [Smallanthus sonchifolius]|uniref:Uncharacterized protein n=1 Tax=Smallanthus sonchifolius TaxID=185202 RepID=A0ACB9EB68_9ASTR|nr:hypothetical protein L1987_55724 [Smallanthus sonchifolius]
MEILQKPVFLLLIFFIILLNLTTFSDSRATLSFADLTPVKAVEHPHGSSASVAGFHGVEWGKDDQGALLLNEMPQESYGAPSGYGNPYPGGIFGFPRGLFGFPGGLFGFPGGLFGFPHGIFGFPHGIFGFPGIYGGNPGVYGVNPGGYDGGQQGGKPGGGGGGYGGKVEVKGK